MSTTEIPAPFETYECSLGTVIAHEANAYVISTPDGRTIGIAANGEPSAENVEDDIANPPAPVVPARRILKDTLIQRVKSAGKLPGLRAMIASLDDDARFEWENSSWFSSENPLIVAGVTALQLDAATTLAPDPLAP